MIELVENVPSIKESGTVVPRSAVIKATLESSSGGSLYILNTRDHLGSYESLGARSFRDAHPSRSILGCTSETRRISLELSRLFLTNADELVHTGGTKLCRLFGLWLIHLLPTSIGDVAYSLHQHRKSLTTDMN
ncbi:hypothetical protein B296_00018900 [Ensete ventricosum]|uniref:Uncharacterized protein n=1 Tax=Ensete ventricosum TaxID=4639 RepID=A0A427A478_ENSVE|nr:hypothetical protein B296_00018900 [Ensete ventricosum]